MYAAICVTTGEGEDFVLGNEVIVAVDGVLESRSGYCKLKRCALVVRILEHTVNQTAGERVTTTYAVDDRVDLVTLALIPVTTRASCIVLRDETCKRQEPEAVIAQAPPPFSA